MYVYGTEEADTLTGTGGSDLLYGAGGDDILVGSDGDDSLIGNAGGDTLQGGNGNDILDGDGLGGPSGNDQLYGGSGADQLDGRGGADLVNGGDGSDVLTLEYDTSVDTLIGGAGADLFVNAKYSTGSIVAAIDHIVDLSVAEGDRIDLQFPNGISPYGNKYLAWSGAVTRPDFKLEPGQTLGPGGMGRDFAQVWTWTNAGVTYLIIDTNDNGTLDSYDFVLAFDGAPALGPDAFVAGTFSSNVGTAEADTWTGGGSDDTYLGGGGGDTLSGGGGNDTLSGNDGADWLKGDAGDDHLLGGLGADTLHGGAGSDTIGGGADESTDIVNLLYGDDGNDFVVGGGAGRDMVYGGAGDDVLSGGAGDQLYGGDGADRLSLTAIGYGAVTPGTLDGGAGDDVIYLEAPQVATGGAGADRFSLKFMHNSFSPTNPDGYATVTDFNALEGDRLDFRRSSHYSLPIVWRGSVDNPGFSLTAGDTFSSDDYGSGIYQIWTWTQGSDTYLIVDTNNDGVLQFGVAKPDYVVKFSNPVGLDAGAFLANFLFTGANGTSGADTFQGGGGADVFYGLNGDDQAHGGGGADFLQGNNGADKLWGDDGDDQLNGGAGNDLLQGDDGGDRITGGAGSDVIYGGAGNDQLSTSDSGVMDGDKPDDVNQLFGESGDDLLLGGGAHDLLDGGDGQDTILGGGQMYGQAGDDRIVVNWNGVVLDSFIDGGAGADSLQGSFGDDTLLGGAGRDDLQGDYGSDILFGDLGDRAVNGGAGADWISIGGVPASETRNLTVVYGGEGSDTFVMQVDVGDDGLTVIGGENYLGGPDSDGLDLKAAAGVVQVDLNSTGAQQTGMGVMTLLGVEDVYAGAFGSALTGNGTSNRLFGGLGDDLMHGGSGNDRLYIAQGGADKAYGDEGDDVFVYGQSLESAPPLATDTVIDGGAGIDTIDFGLLHAAVNIELSVKTAMLGIGFGRLSQTGIENLSGGTGDDRFVGDEAANLLAGRTGNDSLLGGAGADTLSGGGGDDSLDGGGGIDTVTYAGATGGITVDLALTTAQNTGGDGIDTLKSIEIVLGSTYADSLTGGAGNDSLNGGAGGDTLDGGLGKDTLMGGAGDDLYRLDSSLDVIVEINGGGFDTAVTLVSYMLAAGVSIDRLETTAGTGALNLTGNEFAQILVGNAGINTLDGKAGSDTMIGGTGNDTYIVDNTGDVIIELVGGGFDTVKTSASTYVLGAELEVLTYSGTGAFKGTGNGLANILTGGTGIDNLDGGAGADRLVGGLGNDTYVVDSAADVVVENAGEGLDLVKATVNTYSLGANIENLTFIGTGNFSGFGNALANVITGANGNDNLDGKAGADRLVGGQGDDVYYTDNVNDTVVELAGQGSDRVLTTLALAATAANVETLIFVGAGAFQGFASATGSSVFGAGGNDTLTGGAGGDFLGGMAGNDILTGNGGADIFYFDGPNTGVDSIADFLSGVDHIELRGNTFGITSLADLAFVAGVAPLTIDAKPTLLYDTATGGLYFDATGGDAGDQVQIAILTGRPAVTFGDFIVA